MPKNVRHLSSFRSFFSASSWHSTWRHLSNVVNILFFFLFFAQGVIFARVPPLDGNFGGGEGRDKVPAKTVQQLGKTLKRCQLN